MPTPKIGNTGGAVLRDRRISSVLNMLNSRGVTKFLQAEMSRPYLVGI